MKGFIGPIERTTEENGDFRRVLYTGKHLQLVLMSLAPGEAIGEEAHKETDQFFRIEAGNGVVEIDGKSSGIKEGDGTADRRRSGLSVSGIRPVR